MDCSRFDLSKAPVRGHRTFSPRRQPWDERDEGREPRSGDRRDPIPNAPCIKFEELFHVPSTILSPRERGMDCSRFDLSEAPVRGHRTFSPRRQPWDERDEGREPRSGDRRDPIPNAPCIKFEGLFHVPSTILSPRKRGSNAFEHPIPHPRFAPQRARDEASGGATFFRPSGPRTDCGAPAAADLRQVGLCAAAHWPFGPWIDCGTLVRT